MHYEDGRRPATKQDWEQLLRAFRLDVRSPVTTTGEPPRQNDAVPIFYRGLKFSSKRNMLDFA